MEEYKSTIGSSLLVPTVQELGKDPMVSVPSKYLLPDQDPVLISDEQFCFPHQIPTIDLDSLISEDSKTASLELEKLHLACNDWGFFQSKLLALPLILILEASPSSFKLVKLKVFKLRKKGIWIPVKPLPNSFIVNVGDVIEEQKLDRNDIFFLVTLPVHTRKPHLFPKLPTPFRETSNTYSWELKDLAMGILEQMEKALKVKTKELTDLFEGGHQAMRMNYYPPCPQPEQVIGLTPYSDAGGLTILLQVSEVEGLQIKKDGIWILVKPLPNSFIVNVGDVIEIITNGAYRSIEHRAIINPKKERLSIATFYSPSFDHEIGPAFSLVTDQSPQKYSWIGVQEFFKGLFARVLDRKSYLDSLKL
ncbi:hypothetical protein FEM48_Zijuj10G0054800 [Ziziphus jujuba var. spinosa]|uniref:Fe2OG dioxygenase domain-containing protein n=1 Tax=Ziziphus jujuba var. spinosa TaxID=714518 RepID=A0A978ULK3_ZIZJJ|nr:hypothetical protein FEM48_Zijuj10G0054800 [Ziziphus jujuba var. spinosa]